MTPRSTVTSSGAAVGSYLENGDSAGRKKNAKSKEGSPKSDMRATDRDVYLGIDPGIVTCTLSVLFPDGQHHTETMKVGKDRGVVRLAKLELAVSKFIWDWKNSIIHVAMESPSFGARHMLHQMGEAAGVIKLVLYDGLRAPICYPTMVAPIQLKKFVMGSAKARKSGILLDVYRQWGEEFHNDNHADAFSLAKVAQAVETGEVHFEYQKQVIDRLTPHTERPGDQRRSQRKRSTPSAHNHR